MPNAKVSAGVGESCGSNSICHSSHTCSHSCFGRRSMKAIQVHNFGGPEALQFEEIPTPKTGKSEVLVRVKAAGVNPYDTYMRAGTYAIKPSLPYTPGSDSAGVVEAV